MKECFPSEYCCIVTHTIPETWYCKNCKHSHNRLYVNNHNTTKYCPKCVPATIKQKSIEITHNNDILSINL